MSAGQPRDLSNAQGPSRGLRCRPIHIPPFGRRREGVVLRPESLKASSWERFHSSDAYSHCDDFALSRFTRSGDPPVPLCCFPFERSLRHRRPLPMVTTIMPPELPEFGISIQPGNFLLSRLLCEPASQPPILHLARRSVRVCLGVDSDDR